MASPRSVRAWIVALLLAALTLMGTPAHARLVDSGPPTETIHPRSAAAKVSKPWERKILKQTNKHRKKHGCTKLKANKKLRKAARKHTKKMAAARTLSHQLPGEASLGKRITKAGYRNWRGVAENIAYGHASPKQMVKAWMQSPGHRRNILNCKYRHLGVGVVIKGGVPWATQDFGHK